MPLRACINVGTRIPISPIPAPIIPNKYPSFDNLTGNSSPFVTGSNGGVKPRIATAPIAIHGAKIAAGIASRSASNNPNPTSCAVVAPLLRKTPNSPDCFSSKFVAVIVT